MPSLSSLSSLNQELAFLILWLCSPVLSSPCGWHQVQFTFIQCDISLDKNCISLLLWGKDNRLIHLLCLGKMEMGDVTLFQVFTDRTCTEWPPFAWDYKCKHLASVLSSFDFRCLDLMYKYAQIRNSVCLCKYLTLTKLFILCTVHLASKLCLERRPSLHGDWGKKLVWIFVKKLFVRHSLSFFSTLF